jgi:hypothetical protein
MQNAVKDYLTRLKLTKQCLATLCSVNTMSLDLKIKVHIENQNKHDLCKERSKFQSPAVTFFSLKMIRLSVKSKN